MPDSPIMSSSQCGPLHCVRREDLHRDVLGQAITLARTARPLRAREVRLLRDAVELRPIPDGEHSNIDFRAGSGGCTQRKLIVPQRGVCALNSIEGD